MTVAADHEMVGYKAGSCMVAFGCDYGCVLDVIMVVFGSEYGCNRSKSSRAKLFLCKTRYTDRQPLGRALGRWLWVLASQGLANE